MRIRCPHCHQPVEVVEDDSLADISCPSCGSSFNLIAGDETVTYSAGQNRTIAHFELLEEVGVGHFGSVWKARDTELDRLVALKIPRKEQLGDVETEQFLREARAAAQLKNPHIVPVHEVGRENHTVYIVSDFVEGATLKEWLAAKRLTPREAAELCVKIARALHHAHQAGVVHRDLKPGNIMMDAAGEPHVMDFGLAKRDSGEITMTVAGQILGTPAYMSPEQARGEGHDADQRADVYSLGVVLFELVTGELPFRGGQRMLIVQILNDEPPRLRRLDSTVPYDLEAICLKCLEKDPDARYETAEELADDLDRWLRGAPVRARAAGQLTRVIRAVARGSNALFLAQLPTFRAAALVAVAVLAVLAALTIPVLAFFPASRFANLPLHSVIETIVAETAFLLAGTLIVFRVAGAGTSRHIWIITGLVLMGTLTGFHAGVSPGHAFVWLRSVAIFGGGACYALVALPERWNNRAPTWLPLPVFLASVALGALSCYGSWVPQMMSEGTFTFVPRMLSVVGGLLFVVAGSIFFTNYLRHRKLEDLIWAVQSVLLAVGGISFDLTALWDVAWWVEPMARLAAFLVPILLIAIVAIRAQKTSPSR